MPFLRRVPAVWLVIIAIVSVQVGATFAKDLFHLTSPVTVSWLRLVVASLFFLTFARPNLTGKTSKDWLIVLGYGLCLVTMNLSIYLSFARIPIGLAVTIEFLGPLALAILGSRRWLDALWVALAGIGVALLGVFPSQIDWLGVGFALLAGAAWAGYIVFAGPVGRRWDGVSGLTLGSLVGAVLLAGPGLAAAGESLANPRVLLVAVLVGLLSSVTPYALELEARRTLPSSLFSILMSLEPAAAALAAWALLSEQLHLIEWLAMACVIVASVGATARTKPQAVVE